MEASFSSCGYVRQAPAFAELGVFRRLGVSPDGSQVVFEVTDELSDGIRWPLVFPANKLPAEEKGIFAVGADGTGLHRVGPASRMVSYHVSLFVFSPNGRMIAYTDLGPSRDNQEAAQIVTLDLDTPERRQVAQLPPVTGLSYFETTYAAFFNEAHTITTGYFCAYEPARDVTAQSEGC